MMNLVVGAKTKQRRLPLWLSCFGLVLAVAAWFLMPALEVPVRPLVVEEREVVVSILSGLVAELPQFSEWTEDFTAQFTQNGVPAFVRSSADADLVRVEEESLFFTAAFFSADSISQRNALAKAVLSLNPGLVSENPELAVDKE